MVSTQKGDTMLKIDNLEEKELIVARYFIRNRKMKSEDFSDKDIFDIWMYKFPNDFKLRKKNFNQQKFVYVEDESGGHLILPNKKGIRKPVIERYNKVWNDCCISVKNLVDKYTIEDCDRNLTKLRKDHEFHLKLKSTLLSCYCRIVSFPTDKLSKYYIESDDEEVEYHYEQSVEYLEQLKQDRRK